MPLSSQNRCGGPHLVPACKFKETQWLYCKKKGHLARVCRAKGSPDLKHSNYLEAQEDDSAYTLFTLHGSNSNPITLDLAFNDVPVKVELDTGAAISVISHSTYLQSSHPSSNSISLGVHHYKLGMVPMSISLGVHHYKLGMVPMYMCNSFPTSLASYYNGC